MTSAVSAEYSCGCAVYRRMGSTLVERVTLCAVHVPEGWHEERWRADLAGGPVYAELCADVGPRGERGSAENISRGFRLAAWRNATLAEVARHCRASR